MKNDAIVWPNWNQDAAAGFISRQNLCTYNEQKDMANYLDHLAQYAAAEWRHFSSRVINILDESTKTWYIIPHHDEKKQKHIAQWLDYPIISDNFSPHGWLVIWKGFAKYRTIRCDRKWRRNIKIFFVSIRRLIYNLLITENTNHQNHSS